MLRRDQHHFVVEDRAGVDEGRPTRALCPVRRYGHLVEVRVIDPLVEEVEDLPHPLQVTPDALRAERVGTGVVLARDTQHGVAADADELPVVLRVEHRVVHPGHRNATEVALVLRRQVDQPLLGRLLAELLALLAGAQSLDALPFPACERRGRVLLDLEVERAVALVVQGVAALVGHRATDVLADAVHLGRAQTLLTRVLVEAGVRAEGAVDPAHVLCGQQTARASEALGAEHEGRGLDLLLRPVRRPVRRRPVRRGGGVAPGTSRQRRRRCCSRTEPAGGRGREPPPPGSEVAQDRSR